MLVDIDGGGHVIETWGFYIVSALPPGGSIRAPIAPEHYQSAYDEYLDLWTKCEGWGFDGVALPEHHFHPLIASPSPHLMIATLASRTSRLRFSTLGSVLSMHHGWRYAEECGMLDYLTGGRFEPGIAPGAGPAEAVKAGIPAQETRPRYHSAAEIFLKAAQSSTITHHDEFHHLDNVAIVPPMRPGLPVWATVMSPESARWCGQRGVKMCTAWMPTSQAAGLAAAYRDAASNAGNPTDAGMLGIRRRVWVADSDAQANEEYEAAVDLVSAFAGEAFETASDSIRQMMMHPDDYAIGSPETVAERLIEQCRAGGYGAVMMFPDFAQFSIQQQHRAHELIGQKVIPALRAAEVGEGTGSAPSRDRPRVHSGKPSVVEGSYTVAMKTPMGTVDGSLELVVRGRNLSGTVTTMMGTFAFDTGSVDGPRAHWQAQGDTPMGPMNMDGTAIIDGDDIWGAIDLGAAMPKLTFEGTRSG
jgi:alkanesulfonate monooxygenase SsuD/methylene tetrahydromethanopterin reductase-like flavin-dependent oxidoreductase (luciferase family)